MLYISSSWSSRAEPLLPPQAEAQLWAMACSCSSVGSMPAPAGWWACRSPGRRPPWPGCPSPPSRHRWHRASHPSRSPHTGQTGRECCRRHTAPSWARGPPDRRRGSHQTCRPARAPGRGWRSRRRRCRNPSGRCGPANPPTSPRPGRRSRRDGCAESSPGP